MKRAIVMGLGVSGRAVAKHLLRKGVKVLGIDQKAVQVEGVDVSWKSWEGVDQVIVSPAVPWNHPWVQKAKEMGLAVIGEAQFALAQIKNRCIGITGTNGKTTLVRLVEHVLRSSGKKVRALGNVGAALTGYLDEADPEEILVVELSSFQLEDLQVRCFEAAAILNITADHLDRYASMEEYARAKIKIQDCLIAGGTLFVSKQVANEYGTLLKKASCSESLAWDLCSYLGISEKEFQHGVQTFQKPAHRIEWVAEINGIAYYNDSKATNVDAVIYAVERLNGQIILLVGGVDKKASYTCWIEPFRGKVKQIVAFGQASPFIERELAREFCFTRVTTLEEAVERAKEAAKKGDTVLLSPGCSSFDQFQSYEHRGEEFKRIITGEKHGPQKNHHHCGFN